MKTDTNEVFISDQYSKLYTFNKECSFSRQNNVVSESI